MHASCLVWIVNGSTGVVMVWVMFSWNTLLLLMPIDHSLNYPTLLCIVAAMAIIFWPDRNKLFPVCIETQISIHLSRGPQLVGSGPVRDLRSLCTRPQATQWWVLFLMHFVCFSGEHNFKGMFKLYYRDKRALGGREDVTHIIKLARCYVNTKLQAHIGVIFIIIIIILK